VHSGKKEKGDQGNIDQSQQYFLGPKTENKIKQNNKQKKKGNNLAKKASRDGREQQNTIRNR
jgi:hypothetical protein